MLHTTIRTTAHTTRQCNTQLHSATHNHTALHTTTHTSTQCYTQLYTQLDSATHTARQYYTQLDNATLVLAGRDENGGSFIVLASGGGGGPRSRWQLMMDPCGGTGQWLWTIVASDGGSWSWGQLTIDWLQQDSLIYSVPPPQILDRYSLLTIIRQFIDLQLFFKMFTPINAAKNLILIMFSFTLDIYCTSVRPGRGIPHMWLSLRFLLSFYLLKGFFSSFSLLLLRVKGRGCHTLLKPYEMNCGLWIWAIQIKFDWLIDTQSYTHN